MKIVLFKLLILFLFFITILGVVLGAFNVFGSFKKSQKNKNKENEKILDRKQWLIKIFIQKPKRKIAWIIQFFMMIMGMWAGSLFFDKLVWLIVIGFISFFIPSFWAKREFNLFIDKFNNQLIDGLVLLSNSLRAGTSFFQGLEILVKESKSPLASYFGEVIREVNLGVTTQDALNGLVKRLPSKELKIAVTAINISRQTGGSLSEILDKLSLTMRERKRIQGKIESLTAQGTMSGYVVSAMPFLLMLVLNLMAPEMMWPLFNTLYGYITIFVICFMVFVAALIIKKIVSIDI